MMQVFKSKQPGQPKQGPGLTPEVFNMKSSKVRGESSWIFSAGGNGLFRSRKYISLCLSIPNQPFFPRPPKMLVTLDVSG
jgi:hypothetical protein